MPPQPPKPRRSPLTDRKGRSDDFVSVAGRLGCDEDKQRFEDQLGKIASQKPKRAKQLVRAVGLEPTTSSFRNAQ